MTTQITTDNIQTSSVYSLQGPRITTIQITDSSYVVLDDTAVSTSGGYIKITGTGFTSGSQVLVNTVAATSTTFVSAVELRAQLPATAAGTYILYVTDTNGGLASKVNGITFSGTPTWVTGSTLTSGVSAVAYSLQLSATSDSTITYTLQAGSTLPTGLSLSSSGLLSGTVTVASDTTYSFTITATDAELQDSPRTFSLTIVAIILDSYFKYVPLLLNTTSTNAQTNNTFLDASTNNYTLTRSGTPTQGSSNPYWPNGQWSNYFTGTTTNTYLTTPTNTAFQLTTSNFTIELWAFITDASATNANFCRTDTGTGFNGMLLGYNNGTNLVWYATSAGASWDIINAGVICSLASVKNQWAHFAFVRNGSTFTAYVNGTQTYTTTSSASIYQAANAFRIGTANNTSDTTNFGGYISNFRYVKGTAVYTSNFTPSTTPLTAITNTQLLTCQSNRFLDNSTNAFAITISGTPQVQAFQPFSPSAAYTTAAYGGSIYNTVKTDGLSVTSTSAITTFTGDFTIDCWVYPTDTSVSSWGIMDTRTNAQTAAPWTWYLVGYSAGWNLQFFNGSYNNFTTKIQANCWTHVVLQRNGTTLRAFVNGVVDATTFTISGTISGGSSTTSINNIKDSSLAGTGNIGYTSNFRIVNGTAVYNTAGFTPPTSPVTAIANTSLLLNYTNGGIYDASVQNNELTIGSAQASTTVAKWSPTSIKFNGTTDYLTIPSNPVLAFGTGDFTVEGWIYPTSTAQFNLLTLNASFQFFVANNLLYIYDNGTQTSGGTITLNTWQHIAIARSGTAMKCFINGAQVISVTSSTSFTQGTNQVANNTGASYGAGYVQDLRVTKGIARYTSNFSVPTAAFPTR